MEVIENIGAIIGRGAFKREATYSYPNGQTTSYTANQHCVILAEEPAEYLVSYFDIHTMTQTQVYIPKGEVVFKEVKELSYWVIKHEITGEYWSPARSPSTAPQVYLTRGKAEARRKQIGGKDPNWVVKKWNITESKD